jgi:hypothetical protein
MSTEFDKLVKEFLSHQPAYPTSVVAIRLLSGRIRGKLLSVHGALDRKDTALSRQITGLIERLEAFAQNPEYSRYEAMCVEMAAIVGQLSDRVKDQQWENIIR